MHSQRQAAFILDCYSTVVLMAIFRQRYRTSLTLCRSRTWNHHHTRRGLSSSPSSPALPRCPGFYGPDFGAVAWLNYDDRPRIRSRLLTPAAVASQALPVPPSTTCHTGVSLPLMACGTRPKDARARKNRRHSRVIFSSRGVQACFRRVCVSATAGRSSSS